MSLNPATDVEDQLPATTEKESSRHPSRVDVAIPSIKDKEVDFPDGGIEAWLQVLGSFFCLMNTW